MFSHAAFMLAQRIAPSGGGGGSYVKKDEATTNNDYDQFGDTASRTYLGGSWTAGSSYTLRRGVVQIYKTGTPAFNLQMQIQGDSAGLPDGTAIATSTTVIDTTTLTTSAVATNFDFNSGAAISSGVKYHIVLTTSALGDGSNYIRARINFAGATGQQLSGWNGSFWSTRYSSTQYVFETWAIE